MDIERVLYLAEKKGLKQIYEETERYRRWKFQLFECERTCVIFSGFQLIEEIPKFSVQIPSALKQGEMVTYMYTSDANLVAQVIYDYLREEHRKGCRLRKKERKT